MTTPTETSKAQLVKVKLAKHHTHRGEPKKPKEEIEVTATQQKWLKDKGIIE